MQALAAELQLDIHVELGDSNFDQVLEAARDGGYDLAVGNFVHSTARLAYVSFLPPTVFTDIAVLVAKEEKEEKNPFFKMLDPFTPQLWVALLCIWVRSGHFIWLLEHHGFVNFYKAMGAAPLSGKSCFCCPKHGRTPGSPTRDVTLGEVNAKPALRFGRREYTDSLVEIVLTGSNSFLMVPTDVRTRAARVRLLLVPLHDHVHRWCCVHGESNCLVALN